MRDKKVSHLVNFRINSQSKIMLQNVKSFNVERNPDPMSFQLARFLDNVSIFFQIFLRLKI